MLTVAYDSPCWISYKIIWNIWENASQAWHDYHVYIRVCILYILIYICHNNMYMYLCMHVCRLFFIFRCRLFFNIYLTYCLWSFVSWRFYVIYVVMCVDYYYYFLYSFAILWVIFVRWLLYVSTCMYTCVWIIFLIFIIIFWGIIC